MKKTLRTLLTACALAACAWVGQAHASVVVGGTRVIFPADEREVTIRVSNVGTAPALVQAWIDDGDASASPDTIEAPFLLMPAMFRLDPTKAQTLRLIHTQDAKTPLARDKETLFWLNVLEIPPKPQAGEAGANHLQLAVRTRIKVMFRPQGLPGKPGDAPGQVRWELAHVGNAYRLKGTNPTPYHVNLGALSLVADGQTVDAGSGFIKPGESEEFALPALKNGPRAGAQVQYRAINDYGAVVQGQAPLQSTPAP